eukprot:11431-Chlamydomonas_euryale.AAC.2
MLLPIPSRFPSAGSTVRGRGNCSPGSASGDGAWSWSNVRSTYGLSWMSSRLCSLANAMARCRAHAQRAQTRLAGHTCSEQVAHAASRSHMQEQVTHAREFLLLGKYEHSSAGGTRMIAPPTHTAMPVAMLNGQGQQLKPL